MAPDDPPAEDPCVGAGCMAGEPEVVLPVPDAVGRSVAAEGGCWANAGAATKAAAIRQAAICVLSMLFSCNGRGSRSRKQRLVGTPCCKFRSDYLC